MIAITKSPIPVGPIKTSAMLNGKPVYKTRRTGAKITPRWIIVHSTANEKSTALGERNWLLNPSNDRAASWNYTVDDKQIIEAIPAGELAYGTLDASANHSSINIEMCESGDRVQVIRNTANLVAQLMREYGIPIQNVAGHRRFQNKDCPRILQPGKQWDGFIQLVEAVGKPTGMAYIVGKVPLSDPRGWIAKANQNQALDDLAVVISRNWEELGSVPWIGAWMKAVGESLDK